MSAYVLDSLGRSGMPDSADLSIRLEN
jgi:hypothetical protein